MKQPPSITNTEWEVMRVVWAQPSITAAEIIERLGELDASWHPKTVRTLLARLVKKKALRYKADGRTYVYEATVTEQECTVAASESFLERVFGGSLKPMLAHFVAQRKISAADLDELRALLEKGGEKTPPKRKTK